MVSQFGELNGAQWTSFKTMNTFCSHHGARWRQNLPLKFLALTHLFNTDLRLNEHIFTFLSKTPLRLARGHVFSRTTNRDRQLGQNSKWQKILFFTTNLFPTNEGQTLSKLFRCLKKYEVYVCLIEFIFTSDLISKSTCCFPGVSHWTVSQQVFRGIYGFSVSGKIKP